MPGSGPDEAEEEAEEWNDSINDSDEGYYEFAHFFCSFCWEDLMTMPPTLKKVIFRVWCREDPDDEIHPAAVYETWEATKWYQRRRVEEEQYERTGIWERMEEEYKDGDERKVCFYPWYYRKPFDGLYYCSFICLRLDKN